MPRRLYLPSTNSRNWARDIHTAGFPTLTGPSLKLTRDFQTASNSSARSAVAGLCCWSRRRSKESRSERVNRHSKGLVLQIGQQHGTKLYDVHRRLRRGQRISIIDEQRFKRLVD